MSGVSSDGLTTTALPAATAAAVCTNGIANGKFQGAITATTPIGSCRSSSALVLEVRLRETAHARARALGPRSRRSSVALSTATSSSLVVRLGERLAVLRGHERGDARRPRERRRARPPAAAARRCPARARPALLGGRASETASATASGGVRGTEPSGLERRRVRRLQLACAAALRGPLRAPIRSGGSGPRDSAGGGRSACRDRSPRAAPPATRRGRACGHGRGCARAARGARPAAARARRAIASACPSTSNGFTDSAQSPSSSCAPAFSERMRTPSRSFTSGASLATRLSPS